MNEALRTDGLDEEAVAFVTGKTARPRPERPALAGPKTPAEESSCGLHSDTPEPAPAQNSVSESSEPDTAPVATGIISITIRLPASLPSRLLRASVERKLRRQLPFTQQDIVAEALDSWLRLHGYRG